MTAIDNANSWAAARDMAVEREILRLIADGYALDELELRSSLGGSGIAEIWGRSRRLAIVTPE